MLLGTCVLSAAILLAVAGVAKLRTPGPAATMIVNLLPGRPRARRLARCAGVVELLAGLATVVVGGRVTAALLALCYLVLLAVAVRLATGAERAACGCFGAADGVVGPAHVVLDLAGLGIAVWAVVQSSGPATALFDHGPLVGAGAVLQAVLLAALGYLSITALPALTAARRTLEGVS